jgi:hypothetical protein
VRIPGVAAWISWGPPLNSFTWWGAANEILSVTTDMGITYSERIPSYGRNGMAIWDVAGANGFQVGVYDWMNVWPVEPVHGYMYTTRGRKTQDAYPENRVHEVLRGVPPPLPPPRHPLHIEYAEKFSEGLALLQRFRPDVSFTLNKLTDHAHDLWIYQGKWYDGWVMVPLPRPYTSFPPIIEDAYAYADEWLGRYMASLPEGHVLAVVSDHGYEFNGTHHAFSPPGVLILSGGPFACGQIFEGADVLDVAPTLLATLGLPGLEAMPGGVLTGAFAAGMAPQLARVESYPPPWRVVTREQAEPESDADLRRMREQLKALGYVN